MERELRPEEILDKEQFQGGQYVINAQRGINFENFLRITKAKANGDYNKWREENVKHSCMEPLAEAVKEKWHLTIPITIEEINQGVLDTVETRRDENHLRREYIKIYLKYEDYKGKLI